MRALVLFACLALTGADEPAEFDSTTDAAMGAFKVTLTHPVSEYYEYGGQILQLPNGKFAAAEPDTDYRGDHVAYSADPEDYKGKIVASYHSHPCLSATHWPGKFSNGDLISSRMFNRPSYLLDMCTGDVHYWAPGDPTETAFAGSSLSDLTAVTLATGKIVGHIPVPGKPLEAKK